MELRVNVNSFTTSPKWAWNDRSTRLHTNRAQRRPGISFHAEFSDASIGPVTHHSYLQQCYRVSVMYSGAYNLAGMLRHTYIHSDHTRLVSSPALFTPRQVHSDAHNGHNDPAVMQSDHCHNNTPHTISQHTNMNRGGPELAQSRRAAPYTFILARKHHKNHA